VVLPIREIGDVIFADFFRQSVAGKNPNGISSFSPALPDAIGLRWVACQNDLNPERVESLRAKW
jgi:hypothetical protein